MTSTKCWNFPASPTAWVQKKAKIPCMTWEGDTGTFVGSRIACGVTSPPRALLLPRQLSHLEGQGGEKEATEQLGVGLVSHDHPQAAGEGQPSLPQGAEGPWGETAGSQGRRWEAQGDGAAVSGCSSAGRGAGV